MLIERRFDERANDPLVFLKVVISHLGLFDGVVLVRMRASYAGESILGFRRTTTTLPAALSGRLTQRTAMTYRTSSKSEVRRFDLACPVPEFWRHIGRPAGTT